MGTSMKNLSIVASLFAYGLAGLTGIANAKTLDHTLTDISSVRTGVLSFSVEDMRVKVQGGYVRSVRSWSDGHWAFNKRWGSIRAEDRAARSVALANLAIKRPDECGVDSIPDSGALTRIVREGAVYQRTTSSPNYYQVVDSSDGLIVKYSQWIEPDGQSNLIWKSRDGDWIQYNADGDITGYGDRNDTDVTFRYDTNGNLAGVLDVNGDEVMTYTYEPHSYALTTPLPTGETSVTVYLVDKVSDYTGREVDYTYDANLFLTSVTDVRGQVWQYQYNADGHLEKIIDPLARAITVTHNGNGGVTSIKDADGVGATFEYGGSGDGYRQLRRDTDGKVTETWYNRLGKKTRVAIDLYLGQPCGLPWHPD